MKTQEQETAYIREHVSSIIDWQGLLKDLEQSKFEKTEEHRSDRLCFICSQDLWSYEAKCLANELGYKPDSDNYFEAVCEIEDDMVEQASDLLQLHANNSERNLYCTFDEGAVFAGEYQDL